MVHELISKRYSPRAFSEKPVSSEQLADLFEAARWSPSSRNEQPWRFVVAQKGEAAYDEFLDVLNEWNQLWAQSAPVLIAAVAKMNSSHKNYPNKHAWYDLGQAVAHLTFQATSQGLYLHQMGGFSQDKAKLNLNIPEGFEPVKMIALGYKGTLDRIPENYHADEGKQRIRLPLEDIYFKNTWNSKG